RGRFYIEYLLLFVCFFGSLLIGPAVSAQEKKETTTTVADNKYGEGGTLDSTSDEKRRLLSEIWRDKDRKIRAMHSLGYDDKGNFLGESWGFRGFAGAELYEMTHHLTNTVNQDGKLEK